jgi:hypothetical protein
VSCLSGAMHALGECNCFFKPCDFRELPENECQWFEMLDALRHIRWRRISPEESPERQAVIVMLRNCSRWLRN